MTHTTAPPETVSSPDSAGGVPWLLGILFGLGISGSSAVAVVLPTAADDLGLSPSTSSWVLSGFALTLAVLTPVFGRLADRFGIRWPLVVGVVTMGVGALAAAAAPTAEVLIAARLVQGAGGAAVPVLAVALVSGRYDGRLRAAALGRVAGLSAAIAALAPLVGGVLETAVGWRPVVALPAAGLLLLVPLARVAPSAAQRRPFDVPGAAWVAATASGVILLAQAPSSGPVVAIAGAVLLVAGLPLLRHHVRRRPDGFLPRTVLANRSVTTAASGAMGLQAAWFALLLLVPATLAGYGWSPLAIGVALVPGAAAALVATRTSGALITRHGTRATLLLSAAAAVLALALGGLGVALAIPALLIVAIATVSLSYTAGQPAMLTQVSASTDEDVRGIAIGFATLIFLTGAALGSALVGGLQALLPGWAVLAATAALPLAGIVILSRRASPRDDARGPEGRT